MKEFHAITEDSIAKCKAVGINADQLDELVAGAQVNLTPIERVKYHSQELVFKTEADEQINHNSVADILSKAHDMVSNNLEAKKLLTIPSEQLKIVANAICFYRNHANIDDHTNFDTYSLEQLFSGDYKVDVKLTDSNWDFGQKSGVDIPEYVED